MHRVPSERKEMHETKNGSLACSWPIFQLVAVDLVGPIKGTVA